MDEDIIPKQRKKLPMLKKKKKVSSTNGDLSAFYDLSKNTPLSPLPIDQSVSDSTPTPPNQSSQPSSSLQRQSSSSSLEHPRKHQKRVETVTLVEIDRDVSLTPPPISNNLELQMETEAKWQQMTQDAKTRQVIDDDDIIEVTVKEKAKGDSILVTVQPRLWPPTAPQLASSAYKVSELVSLQKLFVFMASVLKCDRNDVILTLKNAPIYSLLTPAELKIPSGCTLLAYTMSDFRLYEAERLKSLEPEVEVEVELEVQAPVASTFVKIRTKDAVIKVPIELSESIATLISLFQAQSNVQGVQLSFDGSKLSPNQSLEHYDIEDGDLIDASHT